MNAKQDAAPDSTAARVALWRALHVEVDPPPHVLEDEIGLKLLAPDQDWRRRGDMDPQFTRPFRASIVARARFIEDMVIEQAGRGLSQYVILGAGLDSFAQRRPDIASHLKIFEIDRPGPQAWKRRRLIELGFGVPEWLHFVPVDFEAGESWLAGLVAVGFDRNKPAIIVSTGVSMYLTKEANAATFRQAAAFASGSTFAMTFLLPLELAAGRPRDAARAGGGKKGGRKRAGRLSSASSHLRKFWNWPAKLASGKHGIFRLTILPSVISRSGQMAFDRPIVRRSFWWRRFSGAMLHWVALPAGLARRSDLPPSWK